MRLRTATARSAALALALSLGLYTVSGCRDNHAAQTKSLSASTHAATTKARQEIATEDATHVASPTKPALRLTPEHAALRPFDSGVQFVLHRHSANLELDETHAATWSVVPEGVIALDAHGFIRPLRTGQATVKARLGGAQVEAVVDVESESNRTWSFANDIVPLLTRQGCNTGGCHGRADGQNGFRLSLFGYDSAGDYQSLTREQGGRRLDHFQPRASLMLLKATGQVPHGGGQRLVPGSPTYETIAAWIAAGAPDAVDPQSVALDSIQVEPAQLLADEPRVVQLRVLAKLRDGSTRDVTRLAAYRSNDDRVIDVDTTGRAAMRARGESDIVVRFGSRVVTSRLASPINPKLDFDFTGLKRTNFIDDHVFNRLEQLKVPVSPQAPDAVFLRRASFDLTGQLPEPDEVKQFVADADPDKRMKKITELMARRDFLHFWKLKFGDLLQITPARFPATAGAYEFWLEDSLRKNRPWNQMVRELLTTLGDPTDRTTSAAASYALDGPDAQTQAEQTARRFMGVRLRCAQCHNHPFDVWTQDDYYGLAAFFAKVDRGGGGPPGAGSTRIRVAVDPKGTIEHKRTRQPARPQTLDGKLAVMREADDPRGALADWLTTTHNPFFARAMVNWVWTQFFGRGIVDPADDLSTANPPVHPELLDALAEDFIVHGYDLQALIRTISTSQVYGLASSTVEGNQNDHRLFSHQLARPLTAHQMADALARATQVPNVFSGRLRDQNKAIEIFNPTVQSEILDTFGRCSRNEACAPAGAPQVSLRQALLLVGGDVVDSKVSHLNGYLSRLLELAPTPGEIVDFLYMRSLCRAPTPEEKSHWEAELAGAASLREAAEDLFWALLNSREFAFNH